VQIRVTALQSNSVNSEPGEDVILTLT